MKTFPRLLCIIVFSTASTRAYAEASSYYVSQNGNGAEDGKSLANAWSVSQFNNPATWSTTEDSNRIDPGDTVYFSGTINQRVMTPASVGGNGTAQVTLDGYSPDNSCAPTNSAIYGSGNGCYDNQADLRHGIGLGDYNQYITLRDFKITQKTSNTYSGINSGEQSLYIIIRNNYLRECNLRNMSLGVDEWRDEYKSKYLIVQDNKMVNASATTDPAYPEGSVEGHTTVGWMYVLYKGNTIGMDKSWYENGYSSCHSCNIMDFHKTDNVIIENNTIYGSRWSAGEWNGGLICPKEWGGWENFIIRFNNFSEFDSGVAIVTASWYHDNSEHGEHIYVYGNYFHDGFRAMQSYLNARDVNVWSNVFSRTMLAATDAFTYDPGWNNECTGTGTPFPCCPSSCYPDAPDNINIYNNTFYRSGEGYNGNHTGGDGSSDLICDGGWNWSADAVAGHVIRNITKSTTATITGNSWGPPYTILTSPLLTWDNGDEFIISNTDPARGAVQISYSSTNIRIKNNISYNIYPTSNNSTRHGIFDAVSSALDYNTLYNTGGDATWYTGSYCGGGGEKSLAQMQACGKEANGAVRNPDFQNPASDWKLRSTSHEIDAGTSVTFSDGNQCRSVYMADSGSWFSVHSGYDTVEVCTNYALDPAGTDLTTTPPTVAVVDQNDHGTGWERGAFVYVSAPQTCAEKGGSCCSTGQSCDGGSFSSSSDCGSLCCVSGTCTDVPCPTGTADCIGPPDDDCETDITSDMDHCGGCDQPCSLNNATASCVTGGCVIDTCVGDYADCNTTDSDGCETDTLTDADHCGSCLNQCTAQQVCDAGDCVDECAAPKTDCSGSCVDLSSDPDHCGTCTEVCAAAANADAACTAGECAIICHAGWGDCNDDPEDGCEEELDGDGHCPVRIIASCSCHGSGLGEGITWYLLLAIWAAIRRRPPGQSAR